MTWHKQGWLQHMWSPYLSIALIDEKSGFPTGAVPSQQLLLLEPLPGLKCIRFWSPASQPPAPSRAPQTHLTISGTSWEWEPCAPNVLKGWKRGWGFLLLLPRHGQKMYAKYPDSELRSYFSMVEKDYYKISITLRIQTGASLVAQW